MKLLFITKNTDVLKQFVNFSRNGIIATSVHYGILIFLVDVIKAFSPVPATVIAFFGGAIVGFNLNNKYLFSKNIYSSKTENITKFIKYLVMTIIGGIVNILLFILFFKQYSMHYLLAQALAIGLVVFCNFACCKYWVFKENNYAK